MVARPRRRPGILDPGYWHAQAHRPGNFLLNGPVMRRPPVIPVGRYVQPVRGVPLTGGQVQVPVGGFGGATGSGTSVAAFTTLCTTPGTIPAGVYTVAWSVALSGTLGSSDVNNMRLVQVNPLQFIAESVNPAIAGTYPQPPVTISIPAGASLIVSSGPNNATSGAVYTGTITGQGVALASVGPQGLGNVWYPAQVNVQTTSLQNDTSTCQVFLGPAATPVTLLGTIFPGGFGTLAAAVPPLTPGLYLIAQWTGANPRDIASLNVIGTMDSIMPG